MGKRSVRENKNIYQISRENLNLTREAAGEALVYVSPERIEKIESGKSVPHPDEILAMESAYKNPELSNYFCTHECPIGMKYVPELKLKELSQVTIEILAALNDIGEEKEKLIAFSVDGKISGDERKEFDEILGKLNKIECSVRGLKLWIEHAMNTGMIDEEE